MNLYKIICYLFLISTVFFTHGVFANSYTSEMFSSKSQCDEQKKQNDTLYPNFSRSDCVESSDEKFYYNICDTNYCVASQDTSKFIENKEPEVYQYDSSSDYKLDNATNEKLKNLAEGLETKFQEMSESDLEKWNTNFSNVLDQLAEKSKNNDKNLAIIDGIKNQIGIVVTKQKTKNDLCKNKYGIGWKEASFFFESNNMITWIEGNKKNTLACEYIEPEVEIETDYTVEEDKAKSIDVSKPITDETVEENKNSIDKETDITQPIQGLYRATKKQYADTQTSRYTGVDVCVQEFGVAWQESKEKNADAYIMLYNTYGIETSGYTQYWNGKKLVTTPKDKLLHKACVKNTLDTIVDDKYRITQGKYRGNILRDGDICKSEYGNDWKVSKDKVAYTKSFAEHSKTYPNLLAWVLYPNDGDNDCGGYHSNNSWNGTVHRVDNTIRQVNSCSYNFEKNQKDEKYNQHFVCEKENSPKEDISPIVQGLYKTTVNQYSYKEAYGSDFDYCKVEYGRDWKRNTESIDANIMLYSKYKVYTWIEGGEVWNGEKSVNPTKSSNHIACVEDIYHNVNENYKEILTSATPKEIEAYMNKFEQEILSKIRETKDFVFIDDGFAITQKKYYGNQIYTDQSVCPLGYELQKNSQIGSPKIRYNEYYATILGKYVEKNWDKYYPHKPASEKIHIPFRTWSKWDDQTVSRKTLDEIKKIAQSENFEVFNVRLGNPSKFNYGSLDVIENNNYLYIGDGFGNGKVEGPKNTIGTLLPALCVNKNIDLSSSSTDKVNNSKSFKGFEATDQKLYMNNFEDAGRGHLFYAYETAKITGFFNYTNYYGMKSVEYFLPMRVSNRLAFIKKIHKK